MAASDLTAIDTGVLVEAHLPGVANHAESRSALEQLLAADELAVSGVVLQEFVHVAADQRRFPKETPSVAELLQICDFYLRATNVAVLGVDQSDLAGAFDLMSEHDLGADAVATALIAAQLRSHGIARILTRDHDEFAPFGFLETVTPGGSGG